MMSREDLLELIDVSRLTNFLNNLRSKEIVVTEKKKPCWKTIVAVVAVVAAVAGIAYALYRYFNRDMDDEFMDDFDDWDDDELFVEDLEEAEEDTKVSEEE